MEQPSKTGPKGPWKTLSDEQFDMVVGMIRIQCTAEEIAGVLGMSTDTLGRRLVERGYANFADIQERHSAEGKASLRRAQWQKAQAGNPTMLIWLGKQYLGQRDQVDTRISGNAEEPLKIEASLSFDVSSLSDAALDEIVKATTKVVHEADA